MDRNTEVNENSLPSLSYNRSTFRYNVNHKTTFSTGDLVPFYGNILVQPGDTFKINLSFVLRMTTPYFPTMDNLWLDIYFFHYDWLNAWANTKAFWGENLTAPWAPSTEKYVPIIKSGTTGFTSKSIMDHFGGNRLYTQGIYSQRLCLNTYLAVYNEYFRDQNLIAPISIDTSDADITFDKDDSSKGGKLLKVAKYHSYYNSALLQPQKGTAPTLPIGTYAPVITDNSSHTSTYSLQWKATDDSDFLANTYHDVGGIRGGTNGKTISATGIETTRPSGTTKYLYPANLYADLSNAIGATLNAQRYVIAVQHILEKQAIFGSRYREQIFARWGVTSKDQAQHIPEYLGGTRVPLQMNSVAQTSSTDNTSPQGNVAAYSVTVDSDEMFTKSFTEHGIIIGVMCVRQDHTYSQGVDCQNSKRRVYDFYQNELAHIGMQPIYEDELFATNGSQTATNRAIFGYKPAFQEYRSEPDQITGELRPEYQTAGGVNAPLDKWTYADKFASAPVLSQAFIEETAENVDRTIVLPSTTSDQFIMDINMDIVKVSEVPQWGTPGLDKF